MLFIWFMSKYKILYAIKFDLVHGLIFKWYFTMRSIIIIICIRMRRIFVFLTETFLHKCHSFYMFCRKYPFIYIVIVVCFNFRCAIFESVFVIAKYTCGSLNKKYSWRNNDVYLLYVHHVIFLKISPLKLFSVYFCWNALKLGR